MIGVGLVGFGLGGRVFHAPFVEATNGLELRAVVSSDADKVRASLPSVAVAPSIEDLLDLDEIDLVVVSSPDDLHADHAVLCLNAGKHVLVDKPFALNASKAERIVQAAEKTGNKLTVFHNRRWDSDFLSLHRLIADGALGRIVHFESHFDRWKPEIADVWKEKRAGGSWIDLGPHLVDQALVLFGMPSAVQASIAALRDPGGAPDWFHVVLEYPEARIVLCSNKMARDHSLRFVVHGTGGSWIKHGIDSQEQSLVAGGRPTDTGFGFDPTPGLLTSHLDPAASLETPGEAGRYTEFWKSLTRWLEGSGPNPVPPEQALDVMKVLDAGIQSDKEGRRVTF